MKIKDIAIDSTTVYAVGNNRHARKAVVIDKGWGKGGYSSRNFVERKVAGRVIELPLYFFPEGSGLLVQYVDSEGYDVVASIKVINTWEGYQKDNDEAIQRLRVTQQAALSANADLIARVEEAFGEPSEDPTRPSYLKGWTLENIRQSTYGDHSSIPILEAMLWAYKQDR